MPRRSTSRRPIRPGSGASSSPGAGVRRASIAGAGVFKDEASDALDAPALLRRRRPRLPGRRPRFRPHPGTLPGRRPRMARRACGRGDLRHRARERRRARLHRHSEEACHGQPASRRGRLLDRRARLPLRLTLGALAEIEDAFAASEPGGARRALRGGRRSGRATSSRSSRPPSTAPAPTSTARRSPRSSRRKTSPAVADALARLFALELRGGRRPPSKARRREPTRRAVSLGRADRPLRRHAAPGAGRVLGADAARDRHAARLAPATRRDRAALARLMAAASGLRQADLGRNPRPLAPDRGAGCDSSLPDHRTRSP